MNRRTIILLAGIMIAGLAANTALGQDKIEKKAKAQKQVVATAEKSGKAAAKVQKQAVKVSKKAEHQAKKASVKMAKLQTKAEKAARKQKGKMKSATK